MQFAMNELVDAFTKESGILCDVVISSSGKLTAQIKEGAPYEVFVSADMKYPKELCQSGFTTSQPVIYAYGKLVLWSYSDQVRPSIDILTDDKISHIALANPKTAPYGEASIEVLNHYDIYDSVKHKLVFGESISQTNHFITTQSAEVGFTAKSVVLSPEMKEKGNWVEIDDATYSPIAQGMVIIKTKDKQKLEWAEKFEAFMISEAGRDILKNFGYNVPD